MDIFFLKKIIEFEKLKFPKFCNSVNVVGKQKAETKEGYIGAILWLVVDDMVMTLELIAKFDVLMSSI